MVTENRQQYCLALESFWHPLDDDPFLQRFSQTEQATQPTTEKSQFLPFSCFFSNFSHTLKDNRARSTQELQAVLKSEPKVRKVHFNCSNTQHKA